ncbi:hypothetical protein RFI_37511, partial [Reticulomyxa filosa]
NKNTKEYLDAIDMCKWILNQRTIYPMERIKYTIDYIKDKLIDKDGVIKMVDEENYEKLWEEGVTFLLRVNQTELKEILIKDNLLYWAAGRNNSIKKKFDEGWDQFSFLIFRIFFFIGLPKRMTFEQVYEKGIKELQGSIDNLLGQMSRFVMYRLMNLKPCNEMSLMNGELIQPYLVAYFKSNDLNIDENKEWLKEYITN